MSLIGNDLHDALHEYALLFHDEYALNLGCPCSSLSCAGMLAACQAGKIKLAVGVAAMIASLACHRMIAEAFEVLLCRIQRLHSK